MSTKISDLVRLIESCGKAGVKKFTSETEPGVPLHIEFHELPKLPLEIPSQLHNNKNAHVPYIGNYEGATSLAPMGPVEIDPEFSRQEAIRLLEEDFDNLQIEDPEKYEELLAYEKLGDYGENHA